MQSALRELKTKVKDFSGKIREDELLQMINLVARTEMELKKIDNICTEEFEKEIMKYLKEAGKIKK